MPPRKTKVLVVDDEILIAMLIADMLEELDCQVVGPAMTLEDALDLARSEALDLAILDFHLSGQSSEPVAVALTNRGIRYAFASGAGPEPLGHDLKPGVWLQKPIGFRELSQWLESVSG